MRSKSRSSPSRSASTTANSPTRSALAATEPRTRWNSSLVEFSRELSELLLAILVEKEPRIGEPCADDPLVALSDKTFRIVAAVDNGEKMRRKRAILVLENEALLVITQGGDHHLARQLEVLLVDGAAEQPGILNQFHVFRHQRVIGMNPATRFGGEFSGLLVEQTAPFLGIDEHPALGQSAGVIRSGNDIEDVGPMDAVAHGLSARGNPEGRHGHDNVAQDRDQTMNRPNEIVLTEAPAHHLWKTHGGENRGHRFGQDLGGGPALVDNGGGEIIALVGGFGFELLNRHTGLLGKSLGRLGGRTILGKGDPRRRTREPFGAVDLAIRQVIDHDHEPSTRGTDADSRVVESRLGQGASHTFGELHPGAGQGVGRNLFGAEFEQEGGHHSTSSRLLPRG